MPACDELGCECQEIVVSDEPVVVEDHDSDLAFMIELKDASIERLRQIKVERGVYVSTWQRLAIDRAIMRRVK